ncbi:MAG: radical SAM family heme chaperone HemW [Bacteroidetes bacterium]|nr:radical SAM family heme chaperone HemW [Bacteroidota bacterium]
MSGIYIHIPFCKQACHYCNFHFTTSLRRKNELVAALLDEIDLRQSYLDNEIVETVYFGGGTPSLLNFEDLEKIQGSLKQKFSISPDTEVTLEANPDDINREKLKAWKLAGINRLSIGIQSFFEEDLIWMNRAHNALQAKQCIELAQKEGFNNITIDLIYGTPSLTDEKWKRNVDTAISLGIPHLSCYALTVEEKTTLHKLIVQHKKEDINKDAQADQFLLLMNWLEHAGFEHYEISNFAKPGFRSRHNSSYWQGKKYLGLGPSAHSYDSVSRQWNISNNNIYIDSLKKGALAFEKEILTPIQQLNEYIMTSLRTNEGLSLKIIEQKGGSETLNYVKNESRKYVETGKLNEENNVLKLTREGKLLADGIAATLFVG